MDAPRNRHAARNRASIPILLASLMAISPAREKVLEVTRRQYVQRRGSTIRRSLYASRELCLRGRPRLSKKDLVKAPPFRPRGLQRKCRGGLSAPATAPPGYKCQA